MTSILQTSPETSPILGESESESHSAVSDSLWPHGLYTVHGILQARILEWGAFPFSRGSSQPRSPSLAGAFFTSWASKEAPVLEEVCAKSLQSRQTLFDPMVCSLPGSPIHGILQARILNGTLVSCLLHWQVVFVVFPSHPGFITTGLQARGESYYIDTSILWIHLK